MEQDNTQNSASQNDRYPGNLSGETFPARNVPYSPNPGDPMVAPFNNPYYSNPYEQTPPPPLPDVPPYSKVLFLGLLAVMVLAFLFAGVEAIGVGLFGGVLVSMFVIDWKGLLTAGGLLKWKQMSNGKRIGMGCLLYCFFPVFFFIYVFRMGSRVFQARGPVFSKAWNAPAPVKKRAKIGILVGSVSAVVLLIGTLVAPAGTTIASTSSPDAAPTQTITAISTPTPVPSPAATPSPTPVPKWTVVKTFHGNGNKKTPTFSVPDDWRLVWSCDPSSFYGGSYNVIVDVNNPDSSPLDPGAINTICQSGNTGDFTEEHQGGDVYLDVASEGAWTLKVEILK